MTRNVFHVLAALIVFAIHMTSDVSAGERVALVIGNSQYQQVSPLPNPRNDATDLAAVLQRLDFKVSISLDLSYGDMRRALRDFGSAAIGADVALVYFAGHGIEVSRQNYLVPVDARLKTDLDVEYEAIPLDMVMGAVGHAKGLRIILLDACRNNPFVQKIRSISGKRSIGRGLAGVEPSVGTLLSYAAKEGTTADDGDGRNSPYTKALLEHLEEPGLEVNFLFRKVRDNVLKQTDGRQEPFTYGSLPGKKIFLKSPEAKPEVLQTKNDQTAIELAYWDAIKDSDDPADVRSYIEKFPQGQFNFLARSKLGRIDAKAANQKMQAEAATKAEIQTTAETKRNLKEAEAVKDEARRKAEAKLKSEAKVRTRREKELTDWQVVRTSNEPVALQKFLIKYPNGTFNQLARAQLEAAKRLQLAALQPTTSTVVQSDNTVKAETTSGLSTKDLTLKIQQHLARLGCNPGRPDGAWGPKSRRALKAYSQHGKVQWASLDPSPTVLNSLESRKARVCPLVCGRGLVKKGNRCVLRSCPRGQELTRSGTCIAKRKQPVVTKKKTVSRPTTRKPKASAKQCGYCSWHDVANARSIGQKLCGESYRRGKAQGICQ